jgi:hypothetical protein
MDEEQAKEKIKQIETKVRDAILQETTTIRTKVWELSMYYSALSILKSNTACTHNRLVVSHSTHPNRSPNL